MFRKVFALIKAIIAIDNFREKGKKVISCKAKIISTFPKEKVYDTINTIGYIFCH